MKTVFDNYMVAHVWAQQSQAEGRNAANSFSFRGPVLYSYRTPIAAFVPGGAVLHTSHRYSLTTGKHHGAARRAPPPGLRVFCVPDIGHDGGRARTARQPGPNFCSESPKAWAKVHAANLAYLVAEYHAAVAGALRAQAGIGNAYRLSDIAGAAEKARQYAEYFGLPVPVLPLAEDSARCRARWERLASSPEAIARRARRDELERARGILRASQVSEWLQEFRAGGRLAGTFTLCDNSAALRVKGENVETSLGASAPVAHVRRVLAAVDRMRAASPEGRPEACTLGHFTLDRFDSSGVVAGCHFIAWSEIDALRPALAVAA